MHSSIKLKIGIHDFLEWQPLPIPNALPTGIPNVQNKVRRSGLVKHSDKDGK